MYLWILRRFKSFKWMSFSWNCTNVLHEMRFNSSVNSLWQLHEIKASFGFNKIRFDTRLNFMNSKSIEFKSWLCSYIYKQRRGKNQQLRLDVIIPLQMCYYCTFKGRRMQFVIIEAQFSSISMVTKYINVYFEQKKNYQKQCPTNGNISSQNRLGMNS